MSPTKSAFSCSLLFFTLLIGLPLSARAETVDAQGIEQAVDDLLGQFVNQNGRVDYAALKQDPQALDRAYQLISKVSPDSHKETFANYEARYSYWINAYNVAAMKGVIDHYPITSVRDVKPASLYSLVDGGGFFAALKFRFGSKKMSLYKLERGLIFKRFQDPRLHFALNCASIGCPELPNTAFTAKALEAQLEAETRDFLRSPRNLRIDHASKTIEVSSLFDWYRDHFEDWPAKTGAEPAGSITAFIAPYLKEADQQALLANGSDYQITFIPYDWNLNDQASQN